MDVEFIEKVFLDLVDVLDDTTAFNDGPFVRLQANLPLIKEALARIYQYVGEHPFQDRVQEIAFRKVWEPRVMALEYYELWLFALHQYQPVRISLEEYYKRELAVLERLFEQHPFHYQYYKLGLSQLDEEFFLDGKDRLLMPPIEGLIAQFIAAERLQVYIMELLEGGSNKFGEGVSAGHQLKWTGDSINLIELIYGICLTGQVNHGNVTPVQLSKAFESMFGVSLGRPHRRFTEVTRRKRLAATKYLDAARAAVLEKVDDINGR